MSSSVSSESSSDGADKASPPSAKSAGASVDKAVGVRTRDSPAGGTRSAAAAAAGGDSVGSLTVISVSVEQCSYDG